MATPKYYPAPQLPENLAYQDIFDAITEIALTDYATLYSNVNNLMNVLCTPEGTLLEPARPASVDDEVEWDTYRTAIQNYYDTLDQTKQDIEDGLEGVKTGIQNILAMLPPNVWIKLSDDNVPEGWPTESGSPVAAKFFGWHTYDLLTEYAPGLLQLQAAYTSDPSAYPLVDGPDNPAHTIAYDIDTLFKAVPHFNQEAFDRVMLGIYTGPAL